LKDKKLKIGRIPYANLYPIFYYLDRVCDNSRYKIIKGVPSKLNKMLRNGELDISPSSSIEYLKYKSTYRILPWLSISSYGTIKSILLFSKFPIHDLGGKTIAVSSESETSTVLLKIILKEFLSLKCRLKPTTLRSVKNILSTYSGVLHIGDTAMMEAKKLSAVSNQLSGLFVYDLGELWDKYTGLPFVYALWIVRKKSLFEKSELLRQLSFDLINAKKYAHNKLSLIAKQAPQRKWISKKELVDYWNIISYDYTYKHVEGLNLFEKYAKKYDVRLYRSNSSNDST
jgi:chorismate dehydratase